MLKKIGNFIQNSSSIIVAIIFILVVFSPLLKNCHHKDNIVIVDTTYNHIVIDSIKYNIIIRDSIVYKLKEEMKYESEKVYTISDSANIKLFYKLLSE